MCIMIHMRTNIVLDDELFGAAKRYAKARTKKGIIEEALQAFIQVRDREQRTLSYQERLQRLSCRLEATRLTQSPLAQLRADRERT